MEDVLIQEIKRLRKENAEMAQHLAAKRYQMIDNVVNTVYKGIYLVRPKKEAIVEVEEKVEEEEAKRKVEKGRVDIVNVNFYDWDGQEVYKGGAERYVYDLAKLLKEMGYRPQILQGAHEDFKRNYRGIKVLGFKASGDNKRELGKIFNKVSRNAEFIIASPDELAAEIREVPCIAINHSIKFDGPARYEMMSLPEKLENPYSVIIEAIRNVTCCVCVDTNFINWMRTRDYELSKKLIYVPNYYDAKVFRPMEKKHGDEKVVFVFPRRIEESRGSKIVLEAFKKVVKKHPEVELRLVGQVQNEKVQAEIEETIKKYPGKVSHTQYAMEDAYKAYEDADIVLAPTTFTDGTSLVCIEGQASGLPVIASTVGGLPNIIIDHFNGLLISPDAKALEAAMIEMVENPKLRKEMGRRALEVAESAFEKHLWEERWRKVIKDFVKKVKADE